MPDSGLLFRLFEGAEKYDASDIHLNANEFPYLRIQQKLADVKAKGKLTEEEIKKIIEPTLNDKLRKQYNEKGDVDYAYETEIEIDGHKRRVRYRVQLYKSRGAASVAMRRVKLNIPTFEELHLPPAYEKVINLRPKGIIIVGGETGSGKSTTLASMVDYINQREAKHIVTIEDPIEYVLTNAKSRISQRELGQDFPSWSQALKAVVREDPDIIMLGEVRDSDTVRAAITAAEVGHLVLTSLHTAEATQTFYRILNFFPPDEKDAVRQNLSVTLIAIMSQILLPCEKENISIVPATEVLINEPAVRMYIERDEINKLGDIVADGHGDMHDFNSSLRGLLFQEYIDKSTAMKASLNPSKLETMLTQK